ncbi:LacI family DNA-binding transcriptional regulator [Kitasatospora purpeofusca]|uniref:LacI family DNA-binding transcriptional regulator n=1 Tax=Kitasatospora purpeofusca TaxID=67352 RepID=UPI003F4A9008
MAERQAADRIGLSEVARLAHVSEATVSRVINRKSGVSTRTREAVERAMAALNVSRRTEGELVLVVVPELANDVFTRLAEQIEAELSPFGLHVVLSLAVPGSARERIFVESTVGVGLAGAVFLSASNTMARADHTAQRMLTERRVPFVNVNGGAGGAAAPTYSTDDRRAAELAVDHLHALGHRRIAMLAGPPGNLLADRRADGFRAALRKHGLDDEHPLLARQLFTVDGGRRGGAELIAGGATAIVAASDRMALGAASAASRRGLSVPRDLSVVGYDDSPVLDLTAPPLTTVRQPTETLGRHAAQALHLMITGRAVPGGEVLIDPELRIRGSTAAWPAGRG